MWTCGILSCAKEILLMKNKSCWLNTKEEAYVQQFTGRCTCLPSGAGHRIAEFLQCAPSGASLLCFRRARIQAYQLTFITWQDNKTRLLWTKGCPSLALYPHPVWSLYPLGKCWPREYTASDMKFWCLAIALMTSPCPCSLVYPAVILSSERKFPLPSVLIVSVKKSKISISTLAK